jgi:hypothetical protein
MANFVGLGGGGWGVAAALGSSVWLYFLANIGGIDTKEKLVAKKFWC